ncbi:hypothetical protein HZH68_015299 [Vespula germanica]|uniref:Uncharacterized protein n=3 Tax=Vespula TaxID=7451 RepID=A0A834MRE8_VESGE|nr:hypothetical protein HZH66_013792 [Vespula vulgaris]KAF7382380.1 hypothetical protein HZH68_015299 [Vespula germanica]
MGDGERGLGGEKGTRGGNRSDVRQSVTGYPLVSPAWRGPPRHTEPACSHIVGYITSPEYAYRPETVSDVTNEARGKPMRKLRSTNYATDSEALIALATSRLVANVSMNKVNQ